MKLHLALGTSVGVVLALEGCGLILDPRPSDTGVSIDAGEHDAGEHDAHDAFGAFDAPGDTGSDARVGLDAPPFDAPGVDASPDVGLDGGSSTVIDVGENLDAGRDGGSDAGNDSGTDTGTDARDAYTTPDASVLSTTSVDFSGHSYETSIDVSPNGNVVTIGTATTAYYVSWDATTGWSTALHDGSTAAVAVFDDEHGLFASPMLNAWTPPGTYGAVPFSGSPRLLAASNNVFASSDGVTVTLWTAAFTPLPIPGPTTCTPLVTPWPGGVGNLVLSLAVDVGTVCAARVAAGVETSTGARRVFFSGSGTTFTSAAGVRTLGACGSVSVGAAGSVFGDDVALLQRGMEMTLATTAADGPHVLLGPYGTLPGPAATSVALGHNGSTDILLAWTTSDEVRVQSLAQANAVSCPVVSEGDTYAIAGDRVRISDCNSGTVTIAVRTSSSVRIMRVSCPAT